MWPWTVPTATARVMSRVYRVLHGYTFYSPLNSSEANVAQDLKDRPDGSVRVNTEPKAESGQSETCATALTDVGIRGSKKTELQNLHPPQLAPQQAPQQALQLFLSLLSMPSAFLRPYERL